MRITVGFSRVTVLAAAVTLALQWGGGQAALTASANSSKPKAMVHIDGTVPAAIASGRATPISPLSKSAMMSVTIELRTRNEAWLDHFLATQAIHGEYMSQGQFDRHFGATPMQVRAVRDWAKGHGMRITYSSPDGLTIGLRGSVDAVQRALDVQIDRFRYEGHTVFGSAEEPRCRPAFLSMPSSGWTISSSSTAWHRR